MNVIEQYVEFLVYMQEHVYEKVFNEQCKITLIGRHITQYKWQEIIHQYEITRYAWR